MRLLIPLAALMLSIPAWLAAQEDNQAGCVISSKRTHIRISGNQRIVTDSVDMTVLDRRGEEFTSFAFQYPKGCKFSIGHAHISDARGNVLRKLKKSDVGESQYTHDGMTLYDDEYIKYFDLRHNVYPYGVSYSVSEAHPRFMNVGFLFPQGRRNIADGTYTVEVPAGYPLKILSRNLAQPEKTTGRGTDIYTWRYKYEYRKPETNASPLDDTTPYLEVLPEQFTYGVPGSYDSWESFGGWVWALNNGRDKLPESEKARIDTMLQGVEDTREKVRILYHYLQDYNRYVNVKIDLGGLRSYPAEYVCHNRFGDCKALSNYMRAILKYAGIESYYTLACLDSRVPRFEDDFPSNAFNHIVVTVPLEDGTLFLECTSKNFPTGYFGSQNQGRKVLVTERSGSHLIDVPAMTPARTECVYDFRVECPDDRTSTVRLDGKFRGPEFERFLSLSAGWNRNDAEIYLRNYFMGGNLQMTHYGIERPHRDSTFVEVRMEATSPGAYRVMGETMILDNISLGVPAYESPDNRKSSVQIDLPRNDRMTVEYRFDQMRLAAIPQDVTIETPYGIYSIVFGMPDPGILTVTKRIEINAGKIPLEEYPAFYDFMSRIRRRENSKHQISVL